MTNRKNIHKGLVCKNCGEIITIKNFWIHKKSCSNKLQQEVKQNVKDY